MVHLQVMVHRATAKKVLGVGGTTVRPAATTLQTIAKKAADSGDQMARRDTISAAEMISVSMDHRDDRIRLVRMHRIRPVRRPTINPTAKPTPPFDLSLAPGERVFGPSQLAPWVALFTPGCSPILAVDPVLAAS